MAANGGNPTIASKAKECLDLFFACLELLKVGNSPEYWTSLLDQLSRFQIWSSNIGVFASLHASLDYRLREVDDVHDLIFQILTGVDDCLRQLQENCSIKPAFPSDDDIAGHNSGISADEFSEVNNAVRESIDWLHRLSNSIRKASSFGQNERAKLMPLVGPDVRDSQDLTPQWTALYSGTIKREFPALAENLRSRLAQSIVLRRKRIMYRQSRNKRWKLQQESYLHQAEKIDVPQAAPMVTFTEPKKEPGVKLPITHMDTHSQLSATTLQPARLEKTKAHSTISSALTRPLRTQDQNLVPPPPREAMLGKDFVCNYCCIILKCVEGLNVQKWTQHVQKDLDPYVCLFDPCDTPLELYPTSKEWLEHMRTEHAMRWHCVARDHEPAIFLSREEFKAHMRNDHPGKFEDSVIDHIATTSARPLENVFNDDCPFCGEAPADITVHISNHLKYLALYTLPYFEEEVAIADEESSSNGSNNLKMSRTTIRRPTFPVQQFLAHEYEEDFGVIQGQEQDEIPDEDVPDENIELLGDRLGNWCGILVAENEHTQLDAAYLVNDKILSSIYNHSYSVRRRFIDQDPMKRFLQELMIVAASGTADTISEDMVFIMSTDLESFGFAKVEEMFKIVAPGLGPTLTDFFRQGAQAIITEEILEAGAAYHMLGKQLMTVLLERRGADYFITEGVLKAAAGNESCGEEGMRLLLARVQPDVVITEDVLKAIASNRKKGPELIVLVLKLRGADVFITEGVVRAAVGNAESGNRVIMMLFGGSGTGAEITQDAVDTIESAFGLRRLHSSFLRLRTEEIRQDFYQTPLSQSEKWYEFFDINHVRDKFASKQSSHDWLLERLGKANTIRRQFFKHRMNNASSLTVKNAIFQVITTTTQFATGARDRQPYISALRILPLDVLSTLEGQGRPHTKTTQITGSEAKALSLPNVEFDTKNDGSALEEVESIGSQTVYEVDAGVSQSIMTIPRLPDGAEYGMLFQCPYCWTDLIVKNRIAWKKHVLGDLRPYVCTFKECEMRMFGSRNEWFEHELQNHRRQWTCPISEECEHVSFSHVSFKDHLGAAHQMMPGESELEALIIRCEAPVARVLASACSLCDELDELETKLHFANSKYSIEYGVASPTTTVSLGNFKRHLGRHMEQVALFALPSMEDDESGDESFGSQKPLNIIDRTSSIGSRH